MLSLTGRSLGQMMSRSSVSISRVRQSWLILVLMHAGMSANMVDKAFLLLRSLVRACTEDNEDSLMTSLLSFRFSYFSYLLLLFVFILEKFLFLPPFHRKHLLCYTAAVWHWLPRAGCGDSWCGARVCEQTGSGMWPTEREGISSGWSSARGESLGLVCQRMTANPERHTHTAGWGPSLAWTDNYHTDPEENRQMFRLILRHHHFLFYRLWCRDAFYIPNDKIVWRGVHYLRNLFILSARRSQVKNVLKPLSSTSWTWCLIKPLTDTLPERAD